jgi:DNA-binding response OmpR family regulator
MALDHMHEFLKANTVDLIVSDIMMSGDDGLVLAREWRAGEHKTTPILRLVVGGTCKAYLIRAR